jgi:hypothetical protein
MESLCSSETLVNFQRNTQRCIQDDRTLHSHHPESIESYKALMALSHCLQRRRGTPNIRECIYKHISTLSRTYSTWATTVVMRRKNISRFVKNYTFTTLPALLHEIALWYAFSFKCMYVCTYMYLYMYYYVYVCACIHVCMYVSMYACMYGVLCMYICTCRMFYTCVYIRTYVCMQEYVCPCVHAAMYMYISYVCAPRSGLESREYGLRDPSRWPRGTLYPQNLALTSPTCGGRSVGIVRSRTQDTECVCVCPRWQINSLTEVFSFDVQEWTFSSRLLQWFRLHTSNWNCIGGIGQETAVSELKPQIWNSNVPQIGLTDHAGFIAVQYAPLWYLSQEQYCATCLHRSFLLLHKAKILIADSRILWSCVAILRFKALL